MDIEKILAELRLERERVEEAILALERLGVSSAPKRRGRKPKWVKDHASHASPASRKQEEAESKPN